MWGKKHEFCLVLYKFCVGGLLEGILQQTFSVRVLERGGSSVVGCGLGRPQPTTLLLPRSKVKPEAVNAVVSS
jgi:hypothetical protein